MPRKLGPEDTPDPEDNEPDAIGNDGMDDFGGGDSDDSGSESQFHLPSRSLTRDSTPINLTVMSLARS